VNPLGLQAAGEVDAHVAGALRGRRVLVTGASGFVGARLSERLESLGAPTLHSNLLGTVNVLTAAHQTGVRRVIVTGTMMEPDFAGADGVPNSPYAASKWASSVYGRMFHALYDLPVVNLRLFMVYGPGDGDERKLIPCIIQSLLRREAPPLSSGRWPVDWVYIDDVIDAYLCAAVADGVEGRTFDVGSGQLVPIRRVAEILTGLIGNGVRPRFGVRPDRPNEVARVADVAGAQELLGWRARVRLEEGLRRTIEWHAEQLERRVA
jgi:UDP-glucose 4-epimerase